MCANIPEIKQTPDLQDMTIPERPAEHVQRSPSNSSDHLATSNLVAPEIERKGQTKTAHVRPLVVEPACLGLEQKTAVERTSVKHQATKTANRSTSKSAATNSYYRYEGGPLLRLITFLANRLKALETMLLAVLKPITPIVRIITPAKKEAPSSQIKKAPAKKKFEGPTPKFE